jgi:hypothetical protein
VDGAAWLWPTHVYEGLPVGYHFAGGNEECSKFSLGSQGMTNLMMVAIVKTVPLKRGIGLSSDFQEVEMCTCSAAGFNLIDESCICMCTEHHIACSVDNASLGYVAA